MFNSVKLVRKLFAPVHLVLPRVEKTFQGLTCDFHFLSKQEHLIVIELKGVIDSDFLYKCKSESCRLLVSFANQYFSYLFDSMLRK